MHTSSEYCVSYILLSLTTIADQSSWLVQLIPNNSQPALYVARPDQLELQLHCALKFISVVEASIFVIFKVPTSALNVCTMLMIFYHMYHIPSSCMAITVCHGVSQHVLVNPQIDVPPSNKVLIMIKQVALPTKIFRE